MKYHIGETDKNGQAISIDDQLKNEEGVYGTVVPVFMGLDGVITEYPNWDKCEIIREDIKEPQVGGFPDDS